ncbi:hypothetical protein AYO40_06840 [Planctomycetaceae bacterium SCGC AG-212-D15]|nr:hypothetical protein AYO40_06840 [Planctomycetaceae bacterium SCGC AG-212-D15]
MAIASKIEIPLSRAWREPFERSLGCDFRDVAFVAGAERPLAAAGALALACDRHTILLSERLDALPAALKRLVLGHELAHIVQLRRGGEDAGVFLEAEAWRAASAAVRGAPYRVRGRARRPMPASNDAVAFVMDDYAKNYFDTFNQLSGLTVTKSEKFTPIVFETVLDSIVNKHPKVENFLLWAHGNPNGLNMALTNNARINTPVPRVRASGATLTTLMEIDDKQKKIKASSDPDKLLMPDGVTTFQKHVDGLIKGLMIGDDGVNNVLKLMNKIQARQLKTIEFRACNMGTHKAIVEVFRKFFGATKLGAPKAKAAYGTAKPGIGEAAYKALKDVAGTRTDQLGSNKELFAFNFTQDATIGQGVQTTSTATSPTNATGRDVARMDTVACAATTKGTVNQWIASKIMGGKSTIKDEFPIHFLLTTPPSFPLENDYKNNITYAP